MIILHVYIIILHVYIIMYTCTHKYLACNMLMYTRIINHIYMQDNYVYMQDNYVYMYT